MTILHRYEINRNTYEHFPFPCTRIPNKEMTSSKIELFSFQLTCDETSKEAITMTDLILVAVLLHSVPQTN